MHEETKLSKVPIPLEKLIMMSGRNKTAREALLARNKAMNIALNSRAKIEELRNPCREQRCQDDNIYSA